MFGGRLGLPELLLLMVLFMTFGSMIAASIAAWWQIFLKAGHAGTLSLLILVPGVNFGTLLLFAFIDWPIHKTPMLNP